MVLSIIIPAYNEAERLPAMLLDLKNFFKKNDYSYEIIVVNDGSKDDTANVVKDFYKDFSNIRLINILENKGKGYAVKTGMLEAVGERKIFADADGATPFSEILKMLPELDKGNDVVIASRAMKDSKTKTTLFYKVRGRVFNFLVNQILGLKINDLQCGFKLFSKKAADIVFLEQTLDGFAFDIEILYKAKKNGFAIKEVPIVWNNVLGTKVRLIADPIKMFFSIFKVKFLS
ncbi:MAG: dolichyl-phosphate beta-glucosyltransferase [Bdellovibrionota bacterium]